MTTSHVTINIGNHTEYSVNTLSNPLLDASHKPIFHTTTSKPRYAPTYKRHIVIRLPQQLHRKFKSMAYTCSFTMTELIHNLMHERLFTDFAHENEALRTSGIENLEDFYTAQKPRLLNLKTPSWICEWGQYSTLGLYLDDVFYDLFAEECTMRGMDARKHIHSLIIEWMTKKHREWINNGYARRNTHYTATHKPAPIKTRVVRSTASDLSDVMKKHSNHDQFVLNQPTDTPHP